MEHRYRVLLSTALAIASVGVAGYVYLRSASAQADSVREFERTRRDARRPVETAVYAPMAQATESLAAIAAGIRTSAANDPQAERRATAIEAVGSFLAGRLSGADETRSAWASSQVEDGATLRSDLAFNSTFAGYYERLTGEPLPDTADPVATFARLASVEDGSRGGLSLPTGVAVDAEVVAVAVGRYSLANPSWPRPPGPVNEAAIYSVAMVSHASLWRHPEGLQAQLESRGGADVAQVQLLIEFAPGDRRPCLFNLVWAPSRGRWILDSSSVGAPSMEEGTWIKWAF